MKIRLFIAGLVLFGIQNTFAQETPPQTATDSIKQKEMEKVMEA